MATQTGSKRKLSVNIEALEANNTLTLGGNGVATQSWVNTQISNLVASAPTTLDTLNELAAALGDDPNFAATTSTALGNRLRVDTASQGLNSTQKSNGRTNLGLGTAATSDSSSFDAAGEAQAVQDNLDSLSGSLGTAAYTASTAYAAASHNHTSLNLTGSIYNGNANYSIDLKDHSDRTWFRNQVGGWTFQTGTSGDDWTQSFTFYLPAAGTTANNVWAEFGQRDSNDAAAGRYRGLRIVKDTGSVADGDLRAGAIYIGTTRKDQNWDTAYGWGNHASAGYLTSVPAEYLTQTEGDARYLRLTGGTLTGNINANGSILGDGNLFLRSYNNDPKGIFFRDGFEYGDTNQYNLSITCYDDGDGAADGMMISAYDGVFFNVQSGSTPNTKFRVLNNEVKAFVNLISTGNVYASGGNSTEWNTAYSWGNHASAGYLTSLPSHNHDTLYDAAGSADAVNQRIDNEVFPAIPTNNNQLTNGAGYLTSVPTTLSGNRTIGGDLTVSGNQVITAGSNADVKFSVWSGTTYGIGMTSGVTYGGLNDYAMTFCMNNDSDRGFWWGYSGQTKSSGAMSLTTAGVLTVASSITAGGAVTGSNLNISNWDTAYGWGNHASAGYLTSVPNLAASKITSGTFANARISQSSVTQHQSALSIAASQITGLPDSSIPFTNRETSATSNIASTEFDRGEFIINMEDGSRVILGNARVE